MYYLEAEAVSWTIKLDREEKKRSFQEKGRSYQSIAEQLAEEAGLHLTGSVFTCKYTLTTKPGLSAEKTYNAYVGGLTLTGTVLKPEGDKVRVHLAVDQSQEEGKSYPFPYATGYTAEGHTGWYVMPEIGDTVQIIFPTEDENDAYAVQSVRQKDTDKTTDPKVKYLRTPEGKEIKLEKEEILITAKDGVTFVKINKASGVEIITDKAVQVTSGGSVTVTSGDQISMTSANNFSINAGGSLSVTAADSISMTCRENSVKLETPSTGIEMSASKPVKVTGGATMDFTSTGKFTAKSSNEMQLTADQKLEAESKQTLEIKCKDNEMKLESGGKGVAVSSGKAISVDGKDSVDIKSGKAMKLDAGQDLTASSKQKMSLTASSSLEEECSGGSIKLNGDIDLKAKLIKEN